MKDLMEQPGTDKPAELSGEEIKDGTIMIGLGQINDSQIASVNGVKIGRTEIARRSPGKQGVPAGTLQSRKTLLRCKLWIMEKK